MARAVNPTDRVQLERGDSLLVG